MMPVMDGWEFLEAKHNDPRLRSIPVIASSASIDQVEINGVSAFVAKPFSIETVARVARECCVAPSPEG